MNIQQLIFFVDSIDPSLTNPPSNEKAGLLATPLNPFTALLVFGLVVNPKAETAPRQDRKAMEAIFMVQGFCGVGLVD